MSASPITPSMLEMKERNLSAEVEIANGERNAEAALIARVLSGDSPAFYELVRPHVRSIYAAAYSVLGNETDAEDAAQEAVLKAYTHLASFRAEAKFKTWIIQITLNEARMKLRKEHRKLYESLDEQRED